MEPSWFVPTVGRSRIKMLNDLKIMFKRLHPDATTPVYEMPGDCACSLRVIEDYSLAPMERVLARTGIAIELPDGFEAQVRPRSGNAWKKGLTVLNTPGTVDSHYTGEIMVILINLGENKIHIKKGDAVAQMKFSPIYVGHFIETVQLRNTERNVRGFGSTGN